MPELLLTARAKKDLTDLPRTIQEAVVESLTLLEADPEEMGKQLRGRLRGLWSCRVGNYRILYTIEGRRRRVIVRGSATGGSPTGALAAGANKSACRTSLPLDL